MIWDTLQHTNISSSHWLLGYLSVCILNVFVTFGEEYITLDSICSSVELDKTTMQQSLGLCSAVPLCGSLMELAMVP